jgi:hypothetical protein
VPSAILTVVGADGQTASADVADVAQLPERDQPVVVKPRVDAPATVGVGTVLESSEPVWLIAPDSVSYQWLRDGQPIPRATGSAYTVTAADIGHEMSVAVTGRREGFADSTLTSPGVILPGAPIQPPDGPDDPNPPDGPSTPDPPGTPDPPDGPGASNDTTGPSRGGDPSGSGDGSGTKDPTVDAPETPALPGGGQTPHQAVSPPGADSPKDSRVIAVTSIRAAATKIRLARGKTVKVPIVAYPALGSGDEATVQWTRTGDSVQVEGSPAAKGITTKTLGKAFTVLLKAKALGTSKIKVTAGGRSLTLTVTVVPKVKPVTKATISGTKKLRRDQTAALTVKLRPAGATAAVPRWKSSKPAVATIDATGRIVAKKAGKTVITARVGKTKTKVVITVR